MERIVAILIKSIKPGESFSVTDFVYANQEAYSMDRILIESLPTNGVLTLNNTEVTISQLIYSVDIPNIVFTPNSNWNGNTSFLWRGGNTYCFSDDVAQITIAVEAVNDIPIANNGTLNVTYVVGNGTGIGAKINVTRAEVAAIVKRLLAKSSLI